MSDNKPKELKVMLTKEQILGLLKLEAESNDPQCDPNLKWLEIQIRRSITSRKIGNMSIVGQRVAILWASYWQMIAIADSGELLGLEAELDEDEEGGATFNDMSTASIIQALSSRGKLNLIIHQEVCDELARLTEEKEKAKAISYEEQKAQQEIGELRRLLAKYPDQAISLSPL